MYGNSFIYQKTYIINISSHQFDILKLIICNFQCLYFSKLKRHNEGTLKTNKEKNHLLFVPFTKVISNFIKAI